MLRAAQRHASPRLSWPSTLSREFLTSPRAWGTESYAAVWIDADHSVEFRGDYDGHYRIRHDRIDSCGKLTLRHNSRLHHIGIGRRHAGTNVLVLVHDLHIRIVNTDGELLRELQLNPTKDYQPQPTP